MQHEKIIVGMSGGVDSSVAALLLLQQGYKVEGLFMQNWEEETADFGSCESEQDLEAAIQVARKLNIKLNVVNFAKEYYKEVFSSFLDELKNNRTPNPDILCNKKIKFNHFLQHALQLGAKYIATGHYAKITKNGNEFYLHKAMDKTKDQSYFLYALDQKQLSNSIFPLADIQKNKIRTLAKEAGFDNHAKPDSTGICFIGERKFQPFLQQFIQQSPGDIVTLDGDKIGKHNGLTFYTIGQRQGLNIGGLKHYQQKPWYVVRKDITTNELVVVQDSNHPSLLAKTLLATNVHWINPKAANAEFSCTAKIRYRQRDQICNAIYSNGEILLNFAEPQRAITPGQSVVLYKEEVCLGGGIIKEAIDK